MPQFHRKTDPQSDSNKLNQVELRLGGSKVTLAAVGCQKSLNDAIVLCVASSGLDRKRIYTQLDLDAATWSRIESGQANFPVNKLEKLMDLCGNEAPLMWLVNARGYDWTTLREKQNELEKKLADAQAENADLKRLIRLRSKVEAEI